MATNKYLPKKTLFTLRKNHKIPKLKQGTLGISKNQYSEHSQEICIKYALTFKLNWETSIKESQRCIFQRFC